MSQTLEQFLDSDSYNRTSDFYRTALVILALLFAIVVMFTLVVVTMSTLISVTWLFINLFCDQKIIFIPIDFWRQLH